MATSALKSDVGPAKTFFEAVLARRSHYQISKEQVVPDSQVTNIVTEAMLHVPSSFNSQSARVLLLFGDQHDKLWDITSDTLKQIVPEEQFSKTKQKIDGFKGGRGTVLFFEDQDVVKGMQENFALYADRFPQWSEHTSAMHQITVWTALKQVGYGANLQHYNPLIDDKVRSEWKLPSTWDLKAQLVFGKPTGQPGEKTFKPIEQRLVVSGQQQ